jgi:hypothetical protein
MIYPYYERVMMVLKREEKTLLETLGRGACSSFDHYKLLTGKVQGLQEAQEILKQGLKAFQGEET